MARECIRRGEHSAKSDVWSAGCMVIDMISGRVSWHERGFSTTWNAIFELSCARNGPKSLEEINDCEDPLLQCFNVDPQHRPAAAQLLRHHFLARVSPCKMTRPHSRIGVPEELYSFGLQYKQRLRATAHSVSSLRPGGPQKEEC
jgi:serine/threonine protein kinase